jgi:hypothetical protein
MKLIKLLVVLFTVNSFFAQEVKVKEESYSFNFGSKNAIVAHIPFGNKDVLEKELKSEMKNWGGKYSSSKDEMSITQGKIKFMGDKPFDAYSKIVANKDGSFEIAVAIDLGGAFMNSKDHGEQYKAMYSKIKDFAIKATQECVAEELKEEEKTLSKLQKEQKNLEKDNKDLNSDIENYKKKIAEAEDKLKSNAKDQSNKKEEIEKQETVVKELEKKKKSIK